MKILNFGSCNLDHVYTLDHIVVPGETETANEFDIFPGGKGLNQSIAAAKAGADVYHAGCIGRDGEMLRRILSDSGVNTSYLETVDVPNGHAVIQVTKKGENSIFIYPGSNETLCEEQIDHVLADFSEGDLLLVQNETNMVPQIIRKGYWKGMKIALNPSPFNEKIVEIDFHCLTYLILNEVEMKEISGSDAPRDGARILRSRYPRLKIVLTLGSKGCVYLDSDQTLSHSAFRVQTVDTTAAGDTFTGYFFAAVAEEIPCSDALRLASAASALAVSRKGAAPSIPYRDEVVRVLPSLNPYPSEDPTEERRRGVTEYLKTHLKDASLTGLAQTLGYSSSYTGNLVKKICNVSFSELIQTVRCYVAADLLVQSDRSVEEIIDFVGYQNESFFRAAFRKRYGMSPKEYRNCKKGK